MFRKQHELKCGVTKSSASCSCFMMRRVLMSFICCIWPEKGKQKVFFFFLAVKATHVFVVEGRRSSHIMQGNERNADRTSLLFASRSPARPFAHHESHIAGSLVEQCVPNQPKALAENKSLTFMTVVNARPTYPPRTKRRLKCVGNKGSWEVAAWWSWLKQYHQKCYWPECYSVRVCRGNAQFYAK